MTKHRTIGIAWIENILTMLETYRSTVRKNKENKSNADSALNCKVWDTLARARTERWKKERKFKYKNQRVQSDIAGHITLQRTAIAQPNIMYIRLCAYTHAYHRILSTVSIVDVNTRYEHHRYAYSCVVRWLTYKASIACAVNHSMRTVEKQRRASCDTILKMCSIEI